MLAVELTPGWVFIVAIAGPVVALASVIVARNGIGAQIKSAERTRDLDIKREAYVDALAHAWLHLDWLNRAVKASGAGEKAAPRPDDMWQWAQMSARLMATGATEVHEAFGTATTRIGFAAEQLRGIERERGAGASGQDLEELRNELLAMRQCAEHGVDDLRDAIRSDLGVEDRPKVREQ